MERSDIYNKYLEALRLKLIAKYDELGLRASGSYEDELEAVVKGDNLKMLGAFHSEFMEHGREPGKFPPRAAIEEWIDNKKGLPAIFQEKKSQMVFLISRKIANEGITVPNSFNKGEVVKSVVDDFLANDLQLMLDEVGELFLPQITSDIIQIFKQVA